MSVIVSHNMVYRAYTALFLALVLLLSGCAGVAGEPVLPSVKKAWSASKAKLVVLGSARSRTLSGKEWDDIRVGMGVSSVLAQAMYDTGCFSLHEDNSKIRERIEKIWEGSSSGRPSASKPGADYSAFVVVERFFFSDSSAFLGLAGLGAARTTINVSVELRNLKTGRSSVSRGSGSATTSTGGILFVYESGTVEFDETTVGKATRQAVYDAVSKIDIP